MDKYISTHICMNVALCIMPTAAPQLQTKTFSNYKYR